MENNRPRGRPRKRKSNNPKGRPIKLQGISENVNEEIDDRQIQNGDMNEYELGDSVEKDQSMGYPEDNHHEHGRLFLLSSYDAVVLKKQRVKKKRKSTMAKRSLK